MRRPALCSSERVFCNRTSRDVRDVPASSLAVRSRMYTLYIPTGCMCLSDFQGATLTA